MAEIFLKDKSENHSVFSEVKMKGHYFKKITALFLAYITVLSCLICCPVALGASDRVFENEIASFPESYKPYLRELHSKYPEWKFEMLDTGLEWADVIVAESSKNRNLVPKTASDLLKSKAPGDYNAKTDTYIEKDAGWVCANSIAVSYFMDPRNFLTETDIFQFELLSFSDKITVQTVEKVLSGTFMANAKITYYDKNGKKKTMSNKYSEVIYDAGKKYDINPCYLASKIRNEVVTSNGNGSGSVSGKYSGYEGYYNFYNIGAYDGKNPIQTGLKWASDTVGTYERPWTDPKKSISGGAKWLAEKYIARGQDTGYLQKFDVAPSSGASIYTHQYMTNVSGADSQGYTTYQSYNSLNLMSVERVFSIPVFKNMPGIDEQTENFKLIDSTNNKGTVNTTTLNMRDIPSTSGNFVVKIPKGTVVTVVAKSKTSSSYFNNYLNNPFWYNIVVTLDGKTYSGYVSAVYIDLTTVISVPANSTFTLPTDIKTDEKPTYYSSDSSVISVNADGSLTSSGSGSCEITAVTSNGGYDFINVKVSSSSVSSLKVTNFSVVGINGSANLKWSAVSGAAGYDVFLYCGDKLVSYNNVSASETSLTVKGLSVSKTYNAKIRAYKLTDKSRTNGNFSSVDDFTINPAKVKNLSCIKMTENSFVLDWDDVNDITGYEVYKYDDESSKYVLFKKVTKSQVQCKTSVAGFARKYKVRAYKTVGSQTYYGSYSSVVTGYTLYKDIGKITQKSLTKTSVTLSWDKIDGAKSYDIYMYVLSSGEYKKVASTTDTTYKIDELSVNSKYEFTVVTNITSSDNSVKYYGSSIEINTLPNPPKNLSVTNVTAEKYTLTWGEVKNATGYRVYKYDTDKKKYVLFTTVTTNSAEVKTTPLSTDRFKVKACIYSEGKTLYSDYSGEITALSAPEKVKGLKYSNVTTSSYTISWSAVKGNIGGYYIYKYNSSSKKYVYLTSTSKTSYTVKSLGSGETASYIVKAFVLNGSDKIMSESSEALEVKTLPEAVSGISISNQTETSFKLKWNKVSGAKGYEIYAYDAESKKYVRVVRTTKTSYTFDDRSPTEKTKIKIRAYLYIGDDKFKGAYSSVFTANTLPADTTSITTKKVSSGKYKLSWKKVEGAGYYRIYLYDSKTGKYKYIDKTENCNYTLTGMKKGTQKVKIKTCLYVKPKYYYSSGKVKSFTVK